MLHNTETSMLISPESQILIYSTKAFMITSCKSILKRDKEKMDRKNLLYPFTKS